MHKLLVTNIKHTEDPYAGGNWGKKAGGEGGGGIFQAALENEQIAHCITAAK